MLWWGNIRSSAHCPVHQSLDNYFIFLFLSCFFSSNEYWQSVSQLGAPGCPLCIHTSTFFSYENLKTTFFFIGTVIVRLSLGALLGPLLHSSTTSKRENIYFNIWIGHRSAEVTSQGGQMKNETSKSDDLSPMRATEPGILIYQEKINEGGRQTRAELWLIFPKLEKIDNWLFFVNKLARNTSLFNMSLYTSSN